MPPFTTKQPQQESRPLEDILPVGSLVYITSYGPYYGLRGIIHTVDAHNAPLYFYLVALQDGRISEPLWFVHDDVVAVEGENS